MHFFPQEVHLSLLAHAAISTSSLVQIFTYGICKQKSCGSIILTCEHQYLTKIQGTISQFWILRTQIMPNLYIPDGNIHTKHCQKTTKTVQNPAGSDL